MRGCLTFLLVVTATILIASWLFLPAAAGGVVGGALGAAGFAGSPTTVTVTADPPVELLAGHADRVVVQARDATFHELSAATVDVTLTDVGLIDRTAGTVSGTLTGIRIAPPSGRVLPISTAKLSGSSSTIQARLSLSLSDVSAMAATAVTSAAGSAPTKVTLASPDRVSIVVGGVTLSGRVVVDPQGGLVFQPVTASPAAGGPAIAGPIDLIRPGPGVPFRIRSVELSASGAVLSATVDPGALAD
jgi:hypothetical protein